MASSTFAAEPIASLAGKTVLVTGASKGIGACAAQAVGAAGAHVIAHYASDRDGAEAATAAIPAERRTLIGADFADAGAARRLWREAIAWRGAVDVLVDNAAVLVDSPLEADDAHWDEAWDVTWAVNVRSAIDLVRDAVAHWLRRDGGVLIAMSSWAAQQGSADPGLLAYTASKAALKATAQTVARAHARDGVLVYVLAPGIVDTRMSPSVAADGAERGTPRSLLAMGEPVPPAELGELVVFLATGRCRHLTGATLDVNGATYVR